jgi:N-acetyl-anhydromuramyl-L-alanine amidase AmpD
MQIHTRLSPNRTAGRGAHIDRLVLHHTGGAFGGSLNWVTNPASQVSYHYMIDPGGVIWRTVNEGDTAWHAGTWAMNSRSIGICGTTGGWTNAARDAFVWLMRDVCGRRGIPINRGAILAHRQVVQTACPGELPIDAWVALAASGATPEPEPPAVDWNSFLIAAAEA